MDCAPLTTKRDLGPLTALPGVGPARAKALLRLGVRSQRDLLHLPPCGLRVWPQLSSAESASGCAEEEVRLAGRVEGLRLTRFGGRRSALRGELVDSSGRCPVVWFNQPWVRERLPEGEAVELAGRVVEGRGGPSLTNPRVGRADCPLPAPGVIEPLYPSTLGLSSDTVGRLCRMVASAHADSAHEPLPGEVLADLGLPTLGVALRNLHTPTSRTAFEEARRRTALEMLLEVQARLQMRRSGLLEGSARVAPVTGNLHAELCARFPFRFTPGQESVIEDLRGDLVRGVPMQRLLQGDVGSGKTAMALFAAMAVVEADGQAALMAPTEVLAEQHFYGTRELLGNAGVEAALLTGSMPRDERRFLLTRLARGDVQVLFGTHALFSADVCFQRLDLVVIDEQHRFGVDQRAALAGKGEDVHLLLMTATPIPRTLALTVYGDLDVSTLEGLPPGRGELRTRWLRGGERRRLAGFLERRLECGEQVFWVCPRIDAGGAGGTAAAERRYEQALASKLSGFGVELVHGRVPAPERSYRLDRFRRGEVGMLVATTVIEVGVDVPSATVMVIEDAERLGLAQLHQLRGRVGRGPLDSHCFLLGDRRAADRFELLERTRDGFELSEADLAARGMGDLAGVRQSGANLEGLADSDVDLDLVFAARDLMRTRLELRDQYWTDGTPMSP